MIPPFYMDETEAEMLPSFPFMPEGIVSGQIREKAVPGQPAGTKRERTWGGKMKDEGRARKR